MVPPVMDEAESVDPPIVPEVAVIAPACDMVTVGAPVGQDKNAVVPLDIVVVFPPFTTESVVDPIVNPPMVPDEAVIVPVMASVVPFQVSLFPAEFPIESLYPDEYPRKNPVPAS